MRIYLILVIMFFVGPAQACLNLTGSLSGSCSYKSPSFGELNGSIEFNIQQPSCSEITIDGSSLKIPGQVEQKVIEGATIDHFKLAMNWENESRQVLNFQYLRTIDENGQRLDEVSLQGHFRKIGRKIILEQTGTVDTDPVDIYCELY